MSIFYSYNYIIIRTWRSIGNRFVIMSNVKIVAKIRYSVGGDLYGKIIFIQDGEYWADDQNYGDDPLEKMTEKSLDMDTSFSLDIDADKPIEDCEQEIIDAYLEALAEMDELQYLDDPSETYLEYK